MIEKDESEDEEAEEELKENAVIDNDVCSVIEKEDNLLFKDVEDLIDCNAIMKRERK